MTEPPTVPVWLDEFNEPTCAALRSTLTELTLQSFDAVYAYLSGIADIEESMRWFGDCWHWTIAFTLPGEDDPLAIIIPAPEDVQIAMPLDRKFVEKLPMRRFKRSVIDGLLLAQEPYNTRWGIWSLPQPSALEDLRQVIDARLTSIVGEDAGKTKRR